MQQSGTYSIINNFIIANSYDEKEYVLRLHDIELDNQKFQSIKEFDSLLKERSIGHITISSDIQIDIDILGEYQDLYENLIISLKIDKNKTKPLYFFTEKGFESYLLSDNSFSDIDHIWLLFTDSSFRSRNIFFEGLSSTNEIEKIIKKNEKINGAKYVRPLNIESQKLLPHDINSWLTESEDVASCGLKSWKEISASKLLVSLGSEIFIEGEQIELLFRGDRRKIIKITKENFSNLQDAFVCVNECANWIYGDSRDIDTRHTIFNNQIISFIPEDDNTQWQAFGLIKILTNSIENTKLSYRYYLQNSSKELSKTLTDLNKTLFDYVGKVRQNTVDLVNNIWKDLTTVLGLLMLNFSIKKPDLPESFFDFLGFGLSIYLALSIFLNARMSFWYYKSLKNNLNDWRTKIYSYLSEDDWSKYALIPLKSAQQKYRMTFFFALALYIIMIGAVLIFAMEIDILGLLNKTKEN